MSKPHDAAFDDCMKDFELPAEAAGAAVAAKGGGVFGAVAGVLAHHGVTEFGEAVCDETITSGALGPPASYIEAKAGYVPGIDQVPDFGWHPNLTFGDHEHPSYIEAKLGYDPSTHTAPQFASNLEEAVPQAHLDRNQWQSDLVPDRMPQDTPFHDPHTGVTWTPDNAITESIWHGASNDCFRGELPAERVGALHANPEYREAFAEVAGHHAYDVDQVTPGAQACYDSTTGTKVEGGPHAGTWDFASPGVEGQRAEHWNMDVSPDRSADNYTSFHHSDGASSGFHNSGSSDMGHDSGGGGSSDGGHSGGDSSGGGSSGGHGE